MASLLPSMTLTPLWKLHSVLHNCSSVRLWFNQIIRRAGHWHTNSPPKSSAAVHQPAGDGAPQTRGFDAVHRPPTHHPSFSKRLFRGLPSLFSHLCPCSPDLRLSPASSVCSFRLLLVFRLPPCWALVFFFFLLCRHLSWECCLSTTRTSSHLW